MCIRCHSLLFFSLSIFKPVVVFPPRLCVSAFYYFFFTLFFFYVRLQFRTHLLCMSTPPTPRGAYIRGQRRAFQQSRSMRLTLSRWHWALL
uniref:Uncharacterized protein n=1 Tax=Human betaherpesvirus 6 TaxID=10368 RepID=A0A5P9U501_9BETA|nr:hypothetical protein [Human betaherpesvirus 6]QFW66640.1 hypothetical protein [Human betaherpesvirus 6]QFW95497.1 hypothetical protein [Human betaherpesvirus 6]QFW95509.1 hypothetical protein [Human betaherpesvirus 6]